MPAADGAAFVGAMDKMLCGMERDLGISALEMEGIRSGLVNDIRGIGADGAAKMGTLQIGGRHVLVPTEANAKLIGLTAQRTEERFSRFKLQWLNKEQLEQRISAGFSAAERAEFHRHSNRLAKNARTFLDEIAELEPDLQEEVDATKAQIDDASNDLTKLELRSSTQMDETLRRSMLGGATREATGASIKTYDLNRNLWNLSLLEHPPAVSRAILANSASRMAARVTKVTSPEFPKRAFMVAGVCPAGTQAVLLNPGGRTAELAWRVMSVETLAARAAANATAVQGAGSGYRTLGEGPGTREFYVPVPPENLDEVRELMAERRAEFLATVEP